MEERTEIYITADWEGENQAVLQLFNWNANDGWGLPLVDSHELVTSNYGSLNCNIKTFMKARLKTTKTFVLIVGDETTSVMDGSCYYCGRYGSATYCARGHSADFRGYVEYECDLAAEDGLNTVVFYDSDTVEKSKCPAALRDKGLHLAMRRSPGSAPAAPDAAPGAQPDWDYESIKAAIQS
ncbi:MAG: molecular chaperone Tir [Coriobacteriia bacterium]|nr:molecular chaperone Tir [Coriobacteriia bacterium]